MLMRGPMFTLLLTFVVVVPASAQTSSLGAKERRLRSGQPTQVATRESPRVVRNKVYSQHSWIAGPPKKAKAFRVGDLVTVIVREQRDYEAESDLQTRKRVNLVAEITEFIKLTKGGIGATGFGRGTPGIDASLNSRMRNQGDAERTDTLTMRLTAKLIDIKPNGVLVLEGKASIQHDAELSVMTITGSCRKEDVTPDNTILSTQLADKSITVDNQGALRDLTRRGWLFRIMDYLRPI